MADDIIYRQAAIDALLHNQEVYSNNFGTDAIDKYTIAIIDNDVQTIAQLPSAQPERKAGKTLSEEVERIKREITDIFAEQMGVQPSAQPNLQPTCNQLATDCISRQAAIDDENSTYNI